MCSTLLLGSSLPRAPIPKFGGGVDEVYNGDSGWEGNSRHAPSRDAAVSKNSVEIASRIRMQNFSPVKNDSHAEYRTERYSLDTDYCFLNVILRIVRILGPAISKHLQKHVRVHKKFNGHQVVRRNSRTQSGRFSQFARESECPDFLLFHQFKEGSLVSRSCSGNSRSQSLMRPRRVESNEQESPARKHCSG